MLATAADARVHDRISGERALPAESDLLALVRRFEPGTAHFTAGEMFFPKTVDDYLRHASQWSFGPQRSAGPTLIAEPGTLHSTGLAAVARARPDSALFLRYALRPLRRDERRAWRKRPDRPKFHAISRTAAVSLLGRVIDAVMRMSLLLRGTVPGGLAATAQKQVVARLDSRPLPLIGSRHRDRLDALDAERFNDRTHHVTPDQPAAQRLPQHPCASRRRRHARPVIHTLSYAIGPDMDQSHIAGGANGPCGVRNEDGSLEHALATAGGDHSRRKIMVYAAGRTHANRVVRVPRHDVGERPFIVIWEVTRACPLACLHCRAVATPDRHPDELSTADAYDLLGQVAAFGKPPPLFVITGGDPFSRPDLRELISHGTRLGLPVAVSPSGTPTLTVANLQAVYAAGARAISLSLDGSTPAIHDSFRGVDGVYGWTLQGWRSARQLGLKVQINTTVTGHNLDDLADIAKVVYEHAAMLWSLFLLVPTGRGRLLPPLTPPEVEDVLNVAYDIGAVLPTKTTEGHHFRRVVIQRRILEERGADHVAILGLGGLYRRLRARLHELGVDAHERRTHRPPLDVSAARGFVFVSHVGDVYPSGFLPLAAGSVRERALVDIYRKSSLFTGLRDPGALAGRCGRCEFRAICGGSRARAFAVTGDPYAEEPWCAYEPGSFPFQAELTSYL